MMSFIKKCGKCKIEKPSEEFSKNRTKKDGFHDECKLCQAKYRAKNKERAKECRAKYYAENKKREKEYRAKYYAENKEREKEIAAKYRAENKERVKECRAKWRAENKDRQKEINRIWRAENKEHIAKWRRKNKEKRNKKTMQRYYNDLNFRLGNVLRSRVGAAIKNGHKSAKTMSLLGCSIEEVKSHLESQFKEGMTWNNYGKWHIDHIIPCASFDLTDPEQQKKCFHYTNLQPLWASENMSKGAKLEYQIERD